MNGAEVAVVGNVVDNFLRVLVQHAQVIPVTAHPGGVVPLRQAGVLPLGLAALGVVPDKNRAQALDHRPALDAGGCRNRAAVIRNVVALAIRAEAPGVIRTTDVVTFDIAAAAVQHHIRGGVGCRQVGFHVGAVGVEQDHLAGGAAPVQRKILAKKAHRQRLVRVEFLGVGNHEPAPWKGEFAESIVLGSGHKKSPDNAVMGNGVMMDLRSPAGIPCLDDGCA